MPDPFVVSPRRLAPSALPTRGAEPSIEARFPAHSSPYVGDESLLGAGRDPRGRPPAALPVDLGLDELGELESYAADAAVTDIVINGEEGMYVDRGAGLHPEPRWRATEREVRALAVELVGRGGRHIDDSTPCVDVRLGQGIRVHAVLPPVSTRGTLISIRVPRAEAATLDALLSLGTFPPEAREWLATAVLARRNVLVTGATGTGKTTLLGALLAHAPAHERIVTIEDVAELRIAHPHHIALEARQANNEGAGAVALDRLVREALRMRPDRIVLGECRGSELRELLTALNTGHDGGAGTLHASSIGDVPARLEALGALAGLDDRALARQVVSAIDVVLHLERTPSGRRLAGAGVFRTSPGGRLEIVEEMPWAG